MKLTYFYSSEIASSIELKNNISSMPISKEFDFCYIDSNSDDFTQLEFLIACHRDDVVIVDCTIPKDKEIKTVYPILVAQVNMLDHVLVVSNTMLPLNITPQRQGYDSPRLKNDFTSEKQLEWIEEQLNDLFRLISSGLHYSRISISNYLDLDNVRPQMEQMWLESERIKSQIEKGKKKILISYRNCHYEEVLAYKVDYEKRHPNTIVRIVEPGVLCSGKETLTPMRKWMLVFMLEDRIHDIDELIIYKTEDYTESWWTCAELVMVAYNNFGRTESNKIKVKYYDVIHKPNIEKDATDWLENIELSIEQKNRLARLAANTRPDTMGPECMENIDQMRSICETINDANFFVRSFLKWSIKKMLKKSIPTSLSKEEQKEMLDKTMKLYTNREELNNYLNDEVFQDDFWQKLSFQLVWPTPAFSLNRETGKYFVDIKKFLSAPMKELIPYSEDDLKIYTENGTITLKDNGQRYVLNVKLANENRYLWLATRMGKPTIKDGNAPGLEKINIFCLS